VTGTFDNWTKSERLERVGQVFEKTVTLPESSDKIYYKVGDLSHSAPPPPCAMFPRRPMCFQRHVRHFPPWQCDSRRHQKKVFHRSADCSPGRMELGSSGELGEDEARSCSSEATIPPPPSVPASTAKEPIRPSATDTQQQHTHLLATFPATNPSRCCFSAVLHAQCVTITFEFPMTHPLAHFMGTSDPTAEQDERRAGDHRRS
jgi:hypothetical protein